MFEPYDPFSLEVAQEHLLSSVKTNIRGILDSYHGDWDFLVELLQNAVDALEQRFGAPGVSVQDKPRIEIKIDVSSGMVRVSDNGIGLDSPMARRILVPNFTTKPYRDSASNRSLRGHKGVGLTFLACSTDYFRFCVKKEGEAVSGELTNGYSWVQDENGEIETPKVRPTNFDPEFLHGYKSGASFEVRVGAQQLARLGLSWLGWYTVTRTMTAAGFCDLNELKIWAKDTTVSLKLIDSNGNAANPPDDYREQFPMSYWYPHELLAACDLDEYHIKHKGTTLVPTAEKAKYDALYVKWGTDRIEEFLFNKGELEPESERYQHYLYTRENLPSVYALFTHSQRVWRAVLDKGLSSDGRRRFWRPGIQIVSHQMPTGQLLEISLPFRAGNKDRIFMLVSLESARPDYGRKGFKAEVNKYTQHLATQAIDYFLKNHELLKPTAIPHGPTFTDAEADADQRIVSVSQLPDLGFKGLNFKKVPRYENDVILLFGELVGRGYLRGYDVLSASPVGQYDAIVNYDFTSDAGKLVYEASTNPLGISKGKVANKNLLLKNLEFKYALEDLLTNFEEEKKHPQQVRFAVVWELGDVTLAGFEVVDLQLSGGPGRREFHGQTHELILDAARIPVVSLKSVLDVLKTKGLLS